MNLQVLAGWWWQVVMGYLGSLGRPCTQLHSYIQNGSPTRTYHTAQGTLLMLCASLDGWGIGERMDTAICTAGSLHCSPEDHNMVNQLWKSVSRSVMSNSLCSHGLQSICLLCPWNFLGKNTGVGSHSLLHGIFPTQESNLGLLYCRQILYCLSHQEASWIGYIPIQDKKVYILK